jgi:hypothetical protein
MGRVCGTYGERGSYRVLVGKPEEKNNLEDLSIDGMILKYVFRKQWEGVDWIDLTWHVYI